jgi:hypothetical protein
MKWKTLLAGAVVMAGLLSVVPTQAAVLDGNDDAASVKSALGLECDLTLLAKFEWGSETGISLTEGLWNDPSKWDISVEPGGLSGDWAWLGNGDGYDLKALAIKAGDYFKVEDITGLTSGDWSTVGILVGGGNNGIGNQPQVSHLSFYGCKSVPEPASVLAGLMALGLGVAGRKYLA